MCALDHCVLHRFLSLWIAHPCSTVTIMSLSEKLIIAAKNGSTREVRKLLGRGALFTKDQVLLNTCIKKNDFTKAYKVAL